MIKMFTLEIIIFLKLHVVLHSTYMNRIGVYYFRRNLTVNLTSTGFLVYKGTIFDLALLPTFSPTHPYA